MPHASKHAFGSSEGSFYFLKICQKVMIVLNHLVQGQVGLASTQTDVIFTT